jgi:hypothetical protein
MKLSFWLEDPVTRTKGAIMNIGDRVVMNDKYKVAETNKGKVFAVRSEPWDLCGTKCVLLEGYRGGYAVDGLTLVGLGFGGGKNEENDNGTASCFS